MNGGSAGERDVFGVADADEPPVRAQVVGRVARRAVEPHLRLAAVFADDFN
jgi:hypothetical protein